jgi:hypothetical protein
LPAHRGRRQDGNGRVGTQRVQPASRRDRQERSHLEGLELHAASL